MRNGGGELGKITNVNIYGLKESVIASSYPMSSGDTPCHKERQISGRDYSRTINLGGAKSGSGHDCFLKGVTVQFDWEISQAIFMQVCRYHFIDIVSSQSKMHRLQMAKKEDFNEYVDPEIMGRYIELLESYNTNSDKDLFYTLVYSCPMGYELTARFTTNYLQLKTIYYQRINHKLKEWHDFCAWIETLPNFMQFIGL